MSHRSRFVSALQNGGFDAAVVSNEINQRYLTGFDFQDGLVLVTANESYLLTDFRYAEAAKVQASKEFSVLTPRDGVRSALKKLLSDNRCKTVAVEEETLSLSDFESLSEKVGSVKLAKGASAMLATLRARKDDLELETIAQAQSVADAAFGHILGWLQPEMTEIEVALELEYFMRKNGAEAVAFDTIAVSGTASSLPHGVPRRKKLEKGFLTMDFGAKVNGYCSDMTRTVVLGKADAEMKKLYDTVLTAQKAALSAAAEGVSCRQLDKIARDIIDGTEFKGAFGHSLGHGVGLFIHESPRLSPAAPTETRLERGNVVTFEPGIYLAGKYGCRIEDMACITGDGRFCDFSQSPKELIELF